jgi:3-hydroxyacyl-[acyl-carrier-protein] dehydratase
MIEADKAPEADQGSAKKKTMSIREIMEILPHRYPMLLIDRITQFEAMQHAVGYKNLTINEPFFQGHFPGNPVLPGVYMIEAMAQLGGTLIMEPDEFHQLTPLLTGIENARFRRQVIPGDRLDMEVTMLRMRSRMGWVNGTAHVDGKLVCSAELMFSLVTVTGLTLDPTVLHE